MSAEINRNRQQQAAVENKINELAQQSRMLEAYMNDIVAREATVARLVEEARLASNAIQTISGDVEKESLMPVGIGVYMKSTIPPVKKLLVNVGAGVVVEKVTEDTINYIESKIKEFEVALAQLGMQKRQIAMNMEQLQHQINSILQGAAQSQQHGFNNNNNNNEGAVGQSH
jgi:prefoldin alpha subunit